MSDLDAEIRQWLAYSADDLSYGALGRESLPRAASWSFQQSAEKALKAIWLLNREVFLGRTTSPIYCLNFRSIMNCRSR